MKGAVRTAVLAFLAAKLAMLAVNLPLFPTIGRTAGVDPRGRRVALLVPMRDEAIRLPATIDGLLAGGADEVLFLDDESSDGSAELVREAVIASGASDVRVLAGTVRPAGWAGKTWACDQLAAATDADVLVFCDVDVQLADGAIRQVVAELDAQQADLLSVFCRQLAGSWFERLLTPLITDVVLCFLPFPLLRVPAARSAATANGALLAFRADAYRRSGGFAAVRGEVVEDVAMARLVRKLGMQLGLALGGELAQVRMYRSPSEVVTGLGRGLAHVTRRRWPVAAGLAWHLLAYTAPVLLSARSWQWRLAAVLGITERLLVEAKTGGRDWAAAAFVAASPVAAIPVVRQALRPTQTWKGRRY